MQPRMQLAFAGRADTADVCSPCLLGPQGLLLKSCFWASWLPMCAAAAWSDLGGCLLAGVSGHMACLQKCKHTLLLQVSLLKSDLSLENVICTSCNTVLFFHHYFVLWEHRFYHVVILQEWLWQQVFSLQSCTNKFWLILIRITKWYKMKQKSTNYANENSTNICLMQWFVSNDSLTACTIYCSALLSQLGVRKVLQYGVGGGIYTDPIASTISFQLALTTPPPSLPSTLLDFFHWIKSGYAAGSSHISTILLQNWLWVTGNPGTGK